MAASEATNVTETAQSLREVPSPPSPQGENDPAPAAQEEPPPPRLCLFNNLCLAELAEETVEASHQSEGEDDVSVTSSQPEMESEQPGIDKSELTIDECEENFYKLLKDYCQPCVTEEPESSDESSQQSNEEQSEDGSDSDEEPSDSDEEPSDSDEEPENPVPNIIKSFVPEGGGIFAYPQELLILMCMMCTTFYFVFILNGITMADYIYKKYATILACISSILFILYQLWKAKPPPAKPVKRKGKIKSKKKLLLAGLIAALTLVASTPPVLVGRQRSLRRRLARKTDKYGMLATPSLDKKTVEEVRTAL